METDTQQMSKQQVRAEFNTWDRDRSYRLHIKRGCEQPCQCEYYECDEADNVDYMVAGLLSGARRRENLHEDYGSAEQMRFTAEVLTHFGPRGLTF